MQRAMNLRMMQVGLRMGAQLLPVKKGALEDAEMDWECLRRSREYRRAWDTYSARRKLLEGTNGQNRRANGRKAERKNFSKAKAKLDAWVWINFYRPWSMMPTDPSRPYTTLTSPERSVLRNPFRQVPRFSIPAAAVNHKMLEQTARDQGLMLPGDFRFSVEIVPIYHQSPLRKRTDLKTFRLQMLAWDMRCSGSTWLKIGKTLKKRGVAGGHSRNEALIIEARNYYEAARKKITAGPCRRVLDKL